MLRFFFILLFFSSLNLPAQEFKFSTDFTVVRVRLFKDLNEFPQIPGGEIKKQSDRLWTLKTKNLSFADKPLPSDALILKKENQKYDLIGLVKMDAYLAGVISQEMSTVWPLEALKAQAIVARSYTLARMIERKNKIFHLESNQSDQVFEMTTSEKAWRAVTETSQDILQTKNGQVLKAFYHADCGGQTVQASQVWPGALDTGVATDPWCRSRKSNQWTFEISKEDFYKNLGINSQPTIEELQNGGEKIQALQLVEKYFSVQKLREIFGFSNIKNSPEKLRLTDDLIQFSGQGFGHGVGLCQRGSLAQARLGRSAIQIVQHYYPDAVLSRNEIKISQILNTSFVSN